jgi:hypothetical protein
MRLALLFAAAVILIRDPTGKWAVTRRWIRRRASLRIAVKEIAAQRNVSGRAAPRQWSRIAANEYREESARGGGAAGEAGPGGSNVGGVGHGELRPYARRSVGGAERLRGVVGEASSSLLERICFHEAGHVACAIAYGVPLISVTIEADRPHLHRAHYRPPPANVADIEQARASRKASRRTR